MKYTHLMVNPPVAPLEEEENRKKAKEKEKEKARLTKENNNI
jgi:hypothetical protein